MQPDDSAVAFQTYLPAALKKKLEKVAEADGLSASAYVRRLLMKHFKEIK
jgi:hypothetical protein